MILKSFVFLWFHIFISLFTIARLQMDLWNIMNQQSSVKKMYRPLTTDSYEHLYGSLSLEFRSNFLEFYHFLFLKYLSHDPSLFLYLYKQFLSSWWSFLGYSFICIHCLYSVVIWVYAFMMIQDLGINWSYRPITVFLILVS